MAHADPQVKVRIPAALYARVKAIALEDPAKPHSQRRVSALCVDVPDGRGSNGYAHPADPLTIGQVVRAAMTIGLDVLARRVNAYDAVKQDGMSASDASALVCKQLGTIQLGDVTTSCAAAKPITWSPALRDAVELPDGRRGTVEELLTDKRQADVVAAVDRLQLPTWAGVERVPWAQLKPVGAGTGLPLATVEWEHLDALGHPAVVRQVWYWGQVGGGQWRKLPRYQASLPASPGHKATVRMFDVFDRATDWVAEMLADRAQGLPVVTEQTTAPQDAAAAQVLDQARQADAHLADQVAPPSVRYLTKEFDQLEDEPPFATISDLQPGGLAWVRAFGRYRVGRILKVGTSRVTLVYETQSSGTVRTVQASWRDLRPIEGSAALPAPVPAPPRDPTTSDLGAIHDLHDWAELRPIPTNTSDHPDETYRALEHAGLVTVQWGHPQRLVKLTDAGTEYKLTTAPEVAPDPLPLFAAGALKPAPMVFAPPPKLWDWHAVADQPAAHFDDLRIGDVVAVPRPKQGGWDEALITAKSSGGGMGASLDVLYKREDEERPKPRTAHVPAANVRLMRWAPRVEKPAPARVETALRAAEVATAPAPAPAPAPDAGRAAADAVSIPQERVLSALIRTERGLPRDPHAKKLSKASFQALERNGLVVADPSQIGGARLTPLGRAAAWALYDDGKLYLAPKGSRPTA